MNSRISGYAFLCLILIPLSACHRSGGDDVAPDIVASISPIANAAGWNNTDVTVRFRCTDEGSGVETCPADIVISTEGVGQIVSATATDEAGNSATVRVTLNIDKTAPSLSIDTPTEGERVFGRLPPVTFEGTAQDGISGLISLACDTSLIPVTGADFDCDIDVVEGDNSVTVTATDEAGNVGSIVRTITYLKPELELAFYDNHQLIWSSYGTSPYSHASFFEPVTESLQPVLTEGFHLLGHFGYQGLINIPNGYAIGVRELEAGSGALISPARYDMVWDTVTAGLASTIPGAFWKPVAPAGYSCLGLVVTPYVDVFRPPVNSNIKCVRDDLVIQYTPTSFEVREMWATGITEVSIPFLATHILPDKSDPAARHAIYPGTFNGSDYSSTIQAIELMNWLDGEKVLHVGMPAADVDPLIRHFGPTVWLHPNELYFPDVPETILNIASLVKAFVLYESNYDLIQVINPEVTDDFNAATFYKKYEDFVLKDPNYYLPAVPPDPPVPNPLFKSWIEYDPLSAFGDTTRAKAFINVLPVDAIFTDIQFWFYYPYNGPARITVWVLGDPTDFDLTTNGRHYGDWEHVTLRILNQTRDMPQHQLAGVYMSRHSQGQWFSRNYFGSQLLFDGTHPVVFSGKYSHAFYPLVGDHIVYAINITGNGAIGTEVWDQTGFGYAFPAYQNYEIVRSGIRDVQVTDENWLGFEGRWGKYEKLESDAHFYAQQEVGAGPYGPNVKNEWSHGDPFDWFWQIEVTEE